MQATNSMVHLHRANIAVEEGQEPMNSRFYIIISALGNNEVLSTSEIFNSKEDALNNAAASARQFGCVWDGRYKDHTVKRPVMKVYAPKEKQPNGAKAKR